MRSNAQRLRKGAAGSSSRWLTVWIVAAWVSALLLPWFGVEGGLQAIVSGTAKAEQLASAMRLAIEGHPRLLMLLVPLVMATAAQIRQNPRLAVAAGLAGIAW